MDNNFVAITQTDVQYVETDRPSVIVVEQSNPSYIEVVNDTPTVVLVEQVTPAYVEVVTKGPQGPPGDIGNADLFLQKENHLAEYANDSQAQQSVQTNIGLGMVDPLAYYILAKA